MLKLAKSHIFMQARNMDITRLKSNNQRMNIIENEDFELLHRGLTNDKKFLSKKYKYLFTVIHIN